MFSTVQQEEKKMQKQRISVVITFLILVVIAVGFFLVAVPRSEKTFGQLTVRVSFSNVVCVTGGPTGRFCGDLGKSFSMTYIDSHGVSKTIKVSKEGEVEEITSISP